MNHLRSMIEKVAPTNSRIMISGASGAGKELVARTIHELSVARLRTVRRAQRGDDRARAHGSGAVRHRAVERHRAARRRAGGGARRHALPRRGRRHAARDAEQDPARAGRPDLRSASAARRGSRVDVRIISSTGRDLEGEIAEGTFREDLFHRLAVVPLRVPALAERREDIPVLVRHFAEQISRATGLPPAR